MNALSEEDVKVARSVMPAMIIGWVICLVGLVVQPWVLLKARALRRNPMLPAQLRGKVDAAYYGSLTYCILAGVGAVAFAVMIAVSAVLSPS